ncbi:hypothetical protein ABH924_003354, partial [Arthrobacter sp. GAS37]|uniref:hypothetical protein n=1 Tax=Arthrobacter sp. GAS37 TaxID=3156261 RepID=UPI003835FB7E
MSEKQAGVAGARKALFGFFTGREGDVSGKPAGEGVEHGVDISGDLHNQLIAAYGTNRRGGVDTAKAAKSLGVTQRAVNYWLSGKYRP